VDDVQEITDLAKRSFLENGYHAPMVFAKGTETKVAIQLAHFGATADERVDDMLNVGTWLAYKHNVGELELIVLVNEAWMGKSMDILPSLDPKRIEILMINSLDVGTQDEYLTCFEVVRNNQGKVIDLKEGDLPKTGHPKGKLLPAFQKGYQIISPVMN